MNIYITPDNERYLREYAKSEDKSMSGLINDLLAGVFNKELAWFKNNIDERLAPSNVPVDAEDAPVKEHSAEDIKNIPF